ncbi:hypothetical protein DWUX_436 [Desulfovibrio diazotrophicus]|nr:hypothetical protein DWUX_436 [Desulfovibrio diazotrophicus]
MRPCPFQEYGLTACGEMTENILGVKSRFYLEFLFKLV